MPKRHGGKPTVEASPLAGMLYFPTALIVDQLPAGLASVGQVPALQAMPAKTHAAKVHKPQCGTGSSTVCRRDSAHAPSHVEGELNIEPGWSQLEGKVLRRLDLLPW